MEMQQFGMSRRSWLKQTAAAALVAASPVPSAIAASGLTAKLFFY